LIQYNYINNNSNNNKFKNLYGNIWLIFLENNLKD